MNKILAIVGRPNVGKSSLFNRLTGRKAAIVHPLSGVTRDRNYQTALMGETPYTLIDTGGMNPDRLEDDPISVQATQAMEEADAILFLLDGKSGLHPDDESLADLLRKKSKVPVLYMVNKIDGEEHLGRMADFHSLGVEIEPISAAHGYNIRRLEEMLEPIFGIDGAPPEEVDPDAPIRIAFVGRPNVGKSTLVNRLLGEERMIVSPEAGTTREAIDTEFEADGQRYILVDTAGVRKKRRIKAQLERQMVWSALQAVQRADVVGLLVDASEGFGEQEVKIADYIFDAGRSLVVLINKWDLAEKETNTLKETLADWRAKYPFLKAVEFLSISGLTGQRVSRIFETCRRAVGSARMRIPTPELNRWVEETQRRHSIPLSHHHQVKIYYMSQVAVEPPTFLFNCSKPQAIGENYRRYLIKRIRETYGFEGSPLRLVFKGRGKHTDQKKVHVG